MDKEWERSIFYTDLFSLYKMLYTDYADLNMIKFWNKMNQQYPVSFSLIDNFFKR